MGRDDRGKGDIIGGSCHKYHFCRDKTFDATNTSLLRQIFVATSTELLSQQAYFCRDKRRVLTRQTCVCCDKYLSPQVFCRGKHIFVVTKDVF